MITSTYRVSLQPGVTPLNIYVSQYDVGQILQFAFVTTGLASYSSLSSSGVSADICGTKPDGNGFQYTGSYYYNSGSPYASFTLKDQMTAVAGKVICEIILYSGTAGSSGYKQLATANFILNVERAALDKDTVKSASEIRQIISIIDRTDELIAAANTVTTQSATVSQLANQVASDKVTATAAASTATSQAAIASAAAESAEATLQAAEEAIEAAKDSAIDDLTDDYNTKLANLQSDYDDKIEEIAATKSRAEANANAALATSTQSSQIASEALSKATNVENESAEYGNQIDELKRELAAVKLSLATKFDDVYLEDGYQNFLADNVVVKEHVGPFAGGGGGGGGSDSGNNARIEAENTSGWLAKTITKGSPCIATLRWSSLENEIATGDGTLSVIVTGVTRGVMNVHQGDVQVDLSNYATVGSNVIRVSIADTYGNSRTFNFSITVVELSISSSFNASQPYIGAVSFPYVPVGNVSKTVHFILDGEEVATHTTSVSGRQQSFTIPQQTHGSHTFRVYFETVINGETVRSNELYYEIICIDPLSDDPVISSSFTITSVAQYTPLHIDYMVYNPASLTSEVTISVNDIPISTVTVDRTNQMFDYRPDNVGTITIDIVSGSVSKHFEIEVTESEIDVEAETEALKLYLTSAGRSNNESATDRLVWSYNDISAQLTGFNWTSDGWVKDADNTTVLRVAGDDRVVIPYKIFENDFRGTGKTIELEFSTSVVMNYDTSIISCYAGGRGLRVTPQMVSLASEQSLITTQYKEDEHVRISFVVEKSSENRLIYCYINGNMSGVVRYPVDDDFSQPDAVGITIGSDDAVTDIYCIRVYDNDLTRTQILDNWIADTQTIDDMLYRYNHNHIYDKYGNVVIQYLPTDLPYIVLTAEELPQYKGDKKTISGYFVNPSARARNFTFTGAQIDVQGTSSQYYARKNYKIKFKNGVILENGTSASKYNFIDGDVPISTFCFKADVASSEGANNVLLARLYSNVCPYKTPGQIANSKVRQGIDGFPMVVFWDDGENIQFMGKYNFNADKSAEEFFGFVEDDESWEIKNNTSNRVLFKSNDFTSMGVDEDGQPVLDWTNDFEARFPDTDPPFMNPAQLKDFADWIITTDRTTATGDALESEVTYDSGRHDENGDPIMVTFTHDTADYRLLKFRNEISNYVELESAEFYYLFTELFLMVDSRAKNAFPSFMGSEIA